MRMVSQCRRAIAAALTLVAAIVASSVLLCADDTKPEPAIENSKAVGLLHLVGAAEADYFRVNGRYATFVEIIKSGQLQRTAVHAPENLPALRTVNLQSDSDPVEGFVLESVLSADGSKYKLSLTRKTDRCGMAVFTDESGVLYQGKATECVAENTPTPTDILPSDWLPPDVDQAIAPARTDLPCPLSQLLQEASNRVEELADNLQRFSAKERIGDADIDKNGKFHNERSSVFDYVAEIREDVPGKTYVEEYRSGKTTIGSSLRLADTGTAAFALIFHPRHIEQFAMTCEGMTSIGTRPVWEVHFTQRSDRANDFHAFRVKDNLYRVKLKGRAWVAADNYQVVRLETDLVEPIKEIDLQVEHLAIDYAPVDFRKRNLQLWLPGSASLYVNYRGHRYQRRHEFSDFQLFWVEAEQEVKETHPLTPSQND